MKVFYFVKNRSTIKKYDITITQWVGVPHVSRYKVVEMIRFLHYKDSAEFYGCLDHQRRSFVFAHESVREFLDEKKDSGFTSIDQKNYDRYKKTVMSLYQQIINQK